LTLYVNGVKDSSTTLPKTFAISEGEIQLASSEIAGNNSDLIIGAYLNTIRGTVSQSNHFAGTIDDVLIYKEALPESQIDEMYEEYLLSLDNSLVDAITFSDTVEATI